MYTLFVILIVIAALLMIGIVLIQESKGGGLASNFSSYNQIGGVRKTTDFVEKTTWGLAIAMVILSVACAYVAPQATGDQSVLERTTTTNPTTNPTNLPGLALVTKMQHSPHRLVRQLLQQMLRQQTKQQLPQPTQKQLPQPTLKQPPQPTLRLLLQKTLKQNNLS